MSGRCRRHPPPSGNKQAYRNQRNAGKQDGEDFAGMEPHVQGYDVRQEDATKLLKPGSGTPGFLHRADEDVGLVKDIPVFKPQRSAGRGRPALRHQTSHGKPS